MAWSSFERGINEICALLGFYAASIGSFLPTFRDKSWWLWNFHSGVEDSYHLGRFVLLIDQFTFIFRANSPRWRHYVPPNRPLPFTSRQGAIFTNTCVKTSCLIEDRARTSYYVWRVFYGSVTIIAVFTKAPYWTYFSFRVLWYIKALFTTNKCTILQSVFFLLHVGANKITRTLQNCAFVDLKYFPFCA